MHRSVMYDTRTYILDYLRGSNLIITHSNKGYNYEVYDRKAKSLGSVSFRRVGGRDVVDRVKVIYNPENIDQIISALGYARCLAHMNLIFEESPIFSSIREEIMSREIPSRQRSFLAELIDKHSRGFTNEPIFGRDPND